jgi:hypothetical protein
MLIVRRELSTLFCHRANVKVRMVNMSAGIITRILPPFLFGGFAFLASLSAISQQTESGFMRFMTAVSAIFGVKANAR